MNDLKTRLKSYAVADEFIVEILSHVEQLEVLLKAAQCPCCDGSGAYYTNMGEVAQCQWCDELSKLITGYTDNE